MKRIVVAAAFLIGALATPRISTVRAQEGVQPGEAYLTRFSGTRSEEGRTIIDPTGSVGSIIDLRTPGGPPQGEHWLDEPQRGEVTADQVGQVFGIAIDDAGTPNVYLAATSAFGLHRTADNAGWMTGMWGAGGGPGSVYVLDGANALKPRLFANMTLDGRANTGAALGNIAYDRWNKQLYVSDLETGMIHRLRASDGTDLGRYDHGIAGRTGFFDAATVSLKQLPGIAFNPASSARTTDCPGGEFSRTPKCWNLADFRRRVWGVGVRQDPASREVRLYYAVWSSEGFGHPDFAAAGDDQRNSLWSIRIGDNGDFDLANVRREFFLPDFFRAPEDLARSGRSHPITDIAFPSFGGQAVMLLAERGGVRNLGLDAESPFARPNESRVLRYELLPQGTWRLAGRYDVGFDDRKDEGAPYVRAASSGGVSFGMGYGEGWNIDTNKPDAFVWMTGDNLCSPKGPCFDRSANTHSTTSYVHGALGRAAKPYEAAEPITAFSNYPQKGPMTPATGPDSSLLIDADINVDAGGGGIQAELARNDATRVGDIEVFQGTQAPAVAPEIPGAAGTEAAELLPPGVQPEAVEPEGWDPAPLPPDGWPLPPPPQINTDLAIHKAGPASCQWGVHCDYTLTVTNVGANSYTGPIAVTDTMPAGATLIGGSAGWHCDAAGAIASCHTLGNALLNPGASASITLSVLLPAAGVGDQVENCADIDWGAMGTEDGAGDTNDHACVVTPVFQGFDLGIEKVGPANCTEGSICSFGILVTNHGPGPYEGVIAVRDQLPPNSSLAVNLPSMSCSQNDGQLACVSPPITLPAGAHELLAIDVMLPSGIAGTTIENCASIDWGAMGANDGAADAFADQDCHSVNIGSGAGFFDLRIGKYGPVHCDGGGNCTYTITVTNMGPDTYVGEIAIQDTPVAGTTFVASSPDWACAAAVPINCHLLGGPHTLHPGDQRSLTLTVLLPLPIVPPGGSPPPFLNCAEFRWTHPGMPPNDSPPPGAPDMSDHSCTNTFTTAGFDISITKTGPAACYDGRVCEYTVTWMNHGPETYSGALAFSDVLPAGAVIESAPGMWTCQTLDPTHVMCNFFEPNLSVGAARTATIRVRLPDPVPGDTATNCASLEWAPAGGFIGPSVTNDANGANDGPSCVSTPILAADLAPFGGTTCRRGATCKLDVRIENRGGRLFRGTAGLKGTLDPTVSIESIKGVSAGLTCSVTGSGRYECSAGELSLEPGSAATLELSIAIPADFAHRRIVHSKEMLWPDRKVKDSRPSNDRHVSIITVLGPEPPPAPPVCAGGEVSGTECVCPQGALKKQTGPNAFACVVLPSAQPPVQCTGGRIRDGECICPEGTRRSRISANAFVCTAPPPPPTEPQCIGGRLVDHKCVCPRGSVLSQTSTNVFRCVEPTPPPSVTCAGGRVRDGECICPSGTERRQVATNAFRCVAPQPEGPQCTGGEVVRGICRCPEGTERRTIGPNAYACARTAPPPRCESGWTEVSRSRAKTLVAQGWQIKEVTSGDRSILCARQRSVTCSGGSVEHGQCICPKGTERTQVGRDAYRCEAIAPPPPAITCSGGTVSGGQCICPKGTERRQVGRNAYRCVTSAPPPPSITCTGGTVVGGQCVCPRGTERRQVGTNAYRCMIVLQQLPQITCEGGSVQGGKCVCPSGTLFQVLGRNHFRCRKLPTVD